MDNRPSAPRYEETNVRLGQAHAFSSGNRRFGLNNALLWWKQLTRERKERLLQLMIDLVALNHSRDREMDTLVSLVLSASKILLDEWLVDCRALLHLGKS